MSMDIKFSIIVPCYNVARYISKCVESVMNQTYTNWELILVDDESTDSTLSILHNFSKMDSRIKVVTKIHGGLPQTRNYGMQHMTGDYLMLLDGDDYFTPNHLEKDVIIIQKSHCDMLIHNQHTNFAEGSANKIVLFERTRDNLSDKEKLEYLFSLDHFLPASAVISTYKVDFIRNNSLSYSEEYRCSEDLDFFHKAISKNPRIEFSYDEFYYYRQDNSGAMTKNLTMDMELDRLSVYKKWFDYFQDKMVGDFDASNIQKRISRDLVDQLFLVSKMDKNSRKNIIKYLKHNMYLFDPNGFYGSLGVVYYFRIPLRRLKTKLKLVFCDFTQYGQK